MRARIAGWLIATTQQATLAHQKPGIATTNHGATNISVTKTTINAEDPTVNAGFSGSKSGQRKKPFNKNNSGLSSLDRILDRPCQIHGTPGTPANHTNRECWFFKQAGRSGAKNKEKGSQSNDDEEEPRSPNTGEQKKFPPQIKTVNMINATHIPAGTGVHS